MQGSLVHHFTVWGTLLWYACCALMLYIGWHAQLATWPPALGCFSLTWGAANVGQWMGPVRVHADHPLGSTARNIGDGVRVLLDVALMALFVVHGTGHDMDELQLLPTRTPFERSAVIAVYVGVYTQMLRAGRRAQLSRVFKYFYLPLMVVQMVAQLRLPAYQQVPPSWSQLLWAGILAAHVCYLPKMQLAPPPPRQPFVYCSWLLPLVGVLCFWGLPGWLRSLAPATVAAWSVLWLAGWAAGLLGQLGVYQAAGWYVSTGTCLVAWQLSTHQVPLYIGARFEYWAVTGPLVAGLLGMALAGVALTLDHGLDRQWTPLFAVVALLALWGLCFFPSGYTFLMTHIAFHGSVTANANADTRIGFRLTLLACGGFGVGVAWTNAVIDWEAVLGYCAVSVAWLLATNSRWAASDSMGRHLRIDALLYTTTLVLWDPHRFLLFGAMLMAEQYASAGAKWIASRQAWYHSPSKVATTLYPSLVRAWGGVFQAVTPFARRDGPIGADR